MKIIEVIVGLIIIIIGIIRVLVPKYLPSIGYHPIVLPDYIFIVIGILIIILGIFRN
jgi:hypothetical protein